MELKDNENLTSREEIMKIAKPILFNTDMVRAILDGRKTVTRRICKDGNDYVVPDMSFYDEDKRTYAVHNYADKEHKDKLSIVERICPICPGDILYVRETWQYIDFEGDNNGFVFKASEDGKSWAENLEGWTWRPSIHMPKAAARIFLRVTDVRVERLQDMGVMDLFKEGVHIEDCVGIDVCGKGCKDCFGIMKNIWNSTIKKSDLDRYGWDANPWVWVIEFERCQI